MLFIVMLLLLGYFQKIWNKAYLEETRQPAPTIKEKKEKVKEETTLNNKINDKKMDRKEEIDNFLEEVEETEPKKEGGKIKSFFKWFGELFQA